MQTLKLNKNGNIELTPEQAYELLKEVWIDGYTDCQIESSLETKRDEAEASWLESLSKNQVLCTQYQNS